MFLLVLYLQFPSTRQRVLTKHFKGLWGLDRERNDTSQNPVKNKKSQQNIANPEGKQEQRNKTYICLPFDMTSSRSMVRLSVMIVLRYCGWRKGLVGFALGFCRFSLYSYRFSSVVLYPYWEKLRKTKGKPINISRKPTKTSDKLSAKPARPFRQPRYWDLPQEDLSPRTKKINENHKKTNKNQDKNN